jgi:predicted ATPase/class 3 adenylate cyclase
MADTGALVLNQRAMRSDLPSGTVTFVFTDVEGSTRLLGELGAGAYAAALAEHRGVVRAACASHDGVEVDTQGDALFVAFATAPGALAACARFTHALADGPIRVRVGVHTGTPLLTEEGYVGDDVHRAARIAAAGHGGQVLVSSATAALVGAAGLRDLGEHRFKDLQAAERVYQLGEEGEFPPLRSLYRSNLPVPATPFLGRDPELADVVELLSSDDVRLLTLTGPGGTGKTRLALQAAADASDSFPDGVWWVPLAPVRDPALIVSSLAQVLEVKERPGRSLLETVVEHLSGKRRLVLLDNVEHLLPAAAGEIAGLRAAAGPTILVTSRERLQLDGEHSWPVPPLEMRDGIELFLARARQLEPSFAHSSAVDELCERLDQLPLALELAAARTPIFSAEQLIERLGQRLDLLRGGRDADPRQQTLRATIEWSYDLLDEDERRLFRSLSVFAGGCTYEAAEAVCDADPDTLQSLLDKSLLRRRDTELGPRYWMLETIHEYAAEWNSDKVGESRARHAEFFAALADRAWASSGTADHPSRLDELEGDHDNLRAALAWAIDTRHARLALRIGESLWEFWYVRGHLDEGERSTAALLVLDGSEAEIHRAWVLLGGGSISRARGDPEGAKKLHNEAFMAFERLDVERGMGISLSDLATDLVFVGDRPGAHECFARAIPLLRELGDDRSLAYALNNYSALLVEDRRFEEAHEAVEEALHTLRGLGDRWGAMAALGNAAVLALASGDLGRARQLFSETLGGAVAVASRTAAAESLEGIAMLDARKGRADRAARLWGVVETLLEETHGVLESVLDSSGDKTRARCVLGDGQYEALRAEGISMNLEEAVAYALGQDTKESSSPTGVARS